MTITYKSLGQANTAATTATTLYTVPAATSTVCSTLVVCNTGAVGSFRIAVRPAGEGLATKHYLIYDAVLSANDSVFLTLGISLAATDVVTVYASTTGFVFNLFGSEVS